MLLFEKTMEEAIQATPVEIEEQLQELIPFAVIRTETELSKYPIHNLSKKGSVNIHIVHNDEKGKADLVWKVSPSRDYGEPRQLAYKIDTLVINRRIDEAGKPLPNLIRLGSLREIAQDLKLGSDTALVRKALLQNASAFITAKLTYKTNDRHVRRLETGFNRYAIIFTGEQLPDGDKADAVYLILSEPYREVLNNAPVRPLDYDYLRKLPPAAQRFYEILSRKIFAALKFRHPVATLTYSDYCTYSAQQRYFERQPMQNQMNAIHREHKKFGYITGVAYTATVDSENRPDWIMSYVPGPKARAEYHTFTRSGRVIELTAEAPEQGTGAAVARTLTTARRRTGPRQKHLNFDQPLDESKTSADPSPIVAEMVRRGISPAKAQALLAGSNPDTIIDQLEWGDQQIRQAGPGEIRNPAGFYIHLIQEKITPPETFATTRRQKERELARDAHNQKVALQAAREETYEAFRTAAVDRHIQEHIRPEDFAALVAEKAAHLQQYKMLPQRTIDEMAERDVRMDIRKELNLPTFEEFCVRLDKGDTTAQT